MRLEAARSTKQSIRLQISRIKETVRKMFNSDTTLRGKIRTLFPEQGITVVSIVAAINLAISTLVPSIVAGVTSAGTITPTPKPTPTPEPGKGGGKEWIQKQLSHIANVLKKLGVATWVHYQASLVV